MKFYNATAPNPFRVRIFLAEKGVEIPTSLDHVNRWDDSLRSRPSWNA